MDAAGSVLFRGCSCVSHRHWSGKRRVESQAERTRESTMLERDLRSFVGVVSDSRDGLTRCFLFVMKLWRESVGSVGVCSRVT
jgi:hypothetical protein